MDLIEAIHANRTEIAQIKKHLLYEKLLCKLEGRALDSELRDLYHRSITIKKIMNAFLVCELKFSRWGGNREETIDPVCLKKVYTKLSHLRDKLETFMDQL